MPSERIQRQIDTLLDQVETAATALEWHRVRDLCDGVLRLDPDNQDAKAFLEAAARDTGVERSGRTVDQHTAAAPPRSAEGTTPDSFAGGRYIVQRFLGEGGKKRVYRAHDELLDRDVAFALIKTEGLDGLRQISGRARGSLV